MEEKAHHFDQLEKAIGYRFTRREWLIQSLTHPSYIQQYPEAGNHNQRLEFLGDALLSAILAQRLYYLLPDQREGILSLSRSALSKGIQLANLARKLRLQACLRLSDGEKQNGGRERDSILEDALEALVGAIFLDSNWETTRRIVLLWYGDIQKHLETLLAGHNPKGHLQELVQPAFGNKAISYKVAEESGPDHDKSFKVRVLIQGTPVGEGEGSSKKEAEEKAARAALLRWPEAD